MKQSQERKVKIASGLKYYVVFVYGGRFGKPPRMRYIEMPAFTSKGHAIVKCVPFIMSLSGAALSRRTPTSAATSPAQGPDKRSVMGLGPSNDHFCAHVCQSQVSYSTENSKKSLICLHSDV